MSGNQPPDEQEDIVEDTRDRIVVLRGQPDPTELAALVAVLASCRGGRVERPVSLAGRRRGPSWTRNPAYRAPNAWTVAALPAARAA